jgi:GxxExxY protein
MPIYPHDERTYQIIGAAMEVHRTLHRGLFEKLYCEALAMEFALRGILFDRQVQCQLVYKGKELSGHYHLDFLCYGEVVVEVKAVSGLTPADEAQILNYLSLTGKRVGLLINFGAKSLEYRRFVLDQQ